MLNSSYVRLEPLWRVVNDCYEGVDAVKSRRNAFVYLPPQPAERRELETGKPFEDSRYAFRKRVATYVNLFKPTIDDIVGIMQKNAPKMRFGVKDDSESPQEVLDMRYRCTRYCDGLTGLKTRLNHAQALFGRYGLLLDITTNSDGLEPAFCVTEYPCFTILDGDYFDALSDETKRLRWLLLDESTRRFRMATKSWEDLPRRRLLAIDSAGDYYTAVFEGTDVDATWTAFDIDHPTPSERCRVVYPSFKGKRLDFIPFTVCNVDRLGIEYWESPPYADVAHIAVGNYVVDSWYKMGLYQFATPTLVITNANSQEQNVRLGGVIWLNSPTNGSQSVNATILETSGTALSELRNAKQELREALRYTSIRDLLDGAGANSSADAMQLRASSGTQTIATIDKTSAHAIEQQLRYAAIWSGATPKEALDRITFESDITYLSHEFQLQSVVGFLQANSSMKILSKQNAYSVLEKALPEVLSSFEDNEAQLLSDDEDSLFRGFNPFVTNAGGGNNEQDAEQQGDINEERAGNNNVLRNE